MSAGTLQRLEERLLKDWHLFDRIKLVRIIMDAFERLSADVDKIISAGSAKDAEIADLKQQLAAAQAQPSGTSDDHLNALADKLETAIGSGSSGTSSGSATAQPVVGSTSTTVTDPTTGTTTTLDHATGTATTTDGTGAPVATDTAAASAATQAATAAGVAVPGA